jgi:recombination protein RecA
MSEKAEKISKKEQSVVDEKRKDAVKKALEMIKKTYGNESITVLGDKPSTKMDVISTGSICIDAILGVGGFPKGRIVEVYGLESSGKTTLALNVIAESQKAGGVCAFIDAEHALDPVYARALGVSTDDLIVSQPSNGEEAIDITDQLVRSHAVDVIVIDSVAALIPKAELEGDVDQAHIGLQARLMSSALRRITGVVAKSNCLVIFINQLRQKINSGPFSRGGPSEVTTGGFALKFFASIRVEVTKSSKIEGGDEHVGNKVKIKVVKNKVAPPFKECVLEMMFGEGISRISEIIMLSEHLEIIKRSGTHYYYNGERVAHGKDNLRTYIKENPAVVEKIKAEINENLDKIDFSDFAPKYSKD